MLSIDLFSNYSKKKVFLKFYFGYAGFLTFSLCLTVFLIQSFPFQDLGFRHCCSMYLVYLKTTFLVVENLTRK